MNDLNLNGKWMTKLIRTSSVLGIAQFFLLSKSFNKIDVKAQLPEATLEDPQCYTHFIEPNTDYKKNPGTVDFRRLSKTTVNF